MGRTAGQKAAPAVETLSFADRPASQTWEQIALPEAPQNYAWAWFKPAHLPTGLILRIPDETYRDCPELARQWTLRKLLQATGVDAVGAVSWVHYGVPFHGLAGTSPYLDAPIAPPVAGVDPNIS